MRSNIITIILYIVAVALTFVTISPINNYTIAVSLLMLIIVTAFLISLALTLTYEGTFKERFNHAMHTGFMLAPACYIAGYIFIIIESLIRN